MASDIKDETRKMAARVSDPLQNPYRKRKGDPHFDDTPACIYFYYIGPADSAGHRPVKHYFHVHGRDPITDKPRPDQSELETKVRMLALNARSGGNNPPQCGEDWKFVVWNHKSYFVVLIDDYDLDFDPGNGIEFTLDGGGTANHSFFDAREFGVPLSYPNGTHLAPAVCCTNYMKQNDAGDDLGDYPEVFHFVLHTNPPLGPAPAPGQVSAMEYPDSGGTNMGPPTPPPGMMVS